MICWLPLGDSALTLVFGDEIDPAIHARLLATAAELRSRPPRGVTEIVPAYTTIGIWFDPLEREAADLAAELVACAESTSVAATAPATREVVIPVHYDGPDLADVAARLHLDPAEVVRRHAAVEYRVYLLGFVPGFAFLGLLDPTLELPRRASPRLKVPAGSVAIAGRQTGIYPLETPGGWHLIGRTEVRLFDANRDAPSMLAVGDRVRFEAVR